MKAQKNMTNVNKIHWADEKEIVHTSLPLKFTLLLLKHIPCFLIRIFIFPVSFFFFVFSPRVRKDCRNYQKHLQHFTDVKQITKTPKKILSYPQILSFSCCIVEKMEGWLGKIKFKQIEYQNDDIESILEDLRQNKGVFVITSHLGNMELLRSLSENNEKLVGRQVPVYVIMDTKITPSFSATLNSINNKVNVNIIDAANIGPDSMVILMEAIEKGALVVIAGDRTPSNNRDKVLKQEFLGEQANFPYGVFLIPFLLKSPVYYMFGLREKISILYPKYKVYIEKSKVDFNCSRAEREEKIKECCKEFVEKLEKFCVRYPYQWYNFFNFWNTGD